MVCSTELIEREVNNVDDHRSMVLFNVVFKGDPTFQ